VDVRRAETGTPIRPGRGPRWQRAWLAVIGLSITLAFAPALNGPFVLDDHVNLAPIWAWLQGQMDAWTAITQNHSGPTGRPLAYLSFLANAAVGGMSPFGFKLLNLMLHLVATGMAVIVIRRAADEDVVPWPIAMVLAVAVLWAINPLHVSTVMYVVQRMALLAAIAILGTVALYLQARHVLDRDPRRGRLLLFAAIPAVTLAGVLAKETAILAPLLCAAAEVTLFRNATPRREVRLFFALFLWLPLVAGLVLFFYAPARLIGGYAGREFTLEQRLLTQPRALAEHAARFLFPIDGGLYRDGYRYSTSLLTPPTTLASILLWSTLAMVALSVRTRAPLFAFGIAWFLIAHALEAGPTALELYFEHRNYLPSLGLVIALAALCRPFIARAPRSAGVFLAGSVMVTLLSLTLVRSYQWADIDRLLAHEGPPAGELSRRLQVDRAIRAVERGDAAARTEALDELAEGNAGDRAARALWRSIFACDVEGTVSRPLLMDLSTEAPRVPTHNHVSWLGLLSQRAARGSCTGLEPSAMLGVLAAWRSAGRESLPAHALSRLAQMEATLKESRK
jgi:hypothetical protein